MNRLKNRRPTPRALPALAAALLLLVAACAGAAQAQQNQQKPAPSPTPTPTPGPASVVVANTADNPAAVRDVDSPARSPYQQVIQVVVPDGQTNGSAFFTVPAGKRLVIEYVTMDLREPTNTPPARVLLETTVFGPGASSIGHFFFLPERHAGHYGTSQEARLYADTGTPVGITLNRSGSAGEARLNASVVGHLVDVQ